MEGTKDFAPALPGKSVTEYELVIAINRGRLLCAENFSWQAVETSFANQISSNYSHEHFLGHLNDKPLAARFFNEKEAPEIPGYQWVGLRELLGRIPDQDFQLAGRALQITRWYREHQFCGVCGTQNVEDNTDRALVCPRCEHRCYPRISPCVIGLVVHGDRILLAQGVRHPEGLYSTLAGFVEPGESAEQAFIREVYEEVGLEVNNLRYIGSQPWPFPGQLMIGFIAEYVSGDIRLQEDEIVAADWFKIDQLPQTPPAATIAGKIIQTYLNEVQEREKTST